MNLEWTTKRPTKEGTYVYKNMRQWFKQLREVKFGNWKESQNPEWLYAGGDLVSNMPEGYWLGPIPEIGD